MRAKDQNSSTGWTRAASLARLPLALVAMVATVSLASVADAAQRPGSSGGGGGRAEDTSALAEGSWCCRQSQ